MLENGDLFDVEELSKELSKFKIDTSREVNLNYKKLHAFGFFITGNDEELKKMQNMIFELALKHNVLVEVINKIDLENKPSIELYSLTNQAMDNDYMQFYEAYLQRTEEDDFREYISGSLDGGTTPGNRGIFNYIPINN